MIESTQSPKDFKVLLITPFPYVNDERYNVNVDAVISRHSGAKTKSGVIYPIGHAYVASVLKNKGFDVNLLDVVPQTISRQEVIKQAAESQMIIMPISSSRYDDTYAFLLANKGKIRIGISNFASIYAEKLLKEGLCDVVVHGEVEFACLEIAQAYLQEQGRDLSKIMGISYLDRDNNIIKTGPRPIFQDLDAIPFPYREKMDHSVYSDIAFLGEPTAFVITARGCPYKCTFCSTHLTYNYKVNYRSAKNVVDEIEEVLARFGVKNFYFLDDTFTLGLKRIEEICQMILDRNLKIKFACLGRIDLVNDKMLNLLKEAGCIDIRFGVESGNDEILKNVKKDLTLQQIERGIALMDKYKIRYSLFFMLGNPGETRQTILDTIRFAKKLNPLFASFNISTPLPGSELFEQHKTFFNFNDIKTFDTVASNFSMCSAPVASLRKLLIYAYISYYFRFRFFARIIMEILHDPKNMFQTICFLYRQGRAVIGKS